jgi:DNA-binding NtrC family response regulator
VSVQSSVLVVDDEAYVRDSLCAVLADEGWLTIPAGGVAAALEVLASRAVDVVVSDLRMPGGDAFVLLERLGDGPARVPVIVVTGVGTLPEAVRAMKSGAYDFLQKPIDPEELLLLAQRAAEHGRLLREMAELRETVLRLRAPRVLVGSSPRMAQVRARIAQVAPTDAPVLITGESGTGKGLAAEELHRQSRRAAEPLRSVHCAALPAEVLDARRGPATAGGTLVLDEVGLLQAEEQAQLLRLLDTPSAQDDKAHSAAPARARIVAISNTDLEHAVRGGGFRADLFWRLNVFGIEMPPLRDHREDIPEIVEHYLSWARSAQQPGSATGSAARPTPAALEVMASYSWPGNVRELCNVLERALIVAGARQLDVAILRDILEPALGTPVIEAGSGDLNLRAQLDAAEKELVLRALARAGNLKKQAAYLLGIDPRNLGYYLRKHGLS